MEGEERRNEGVGEKWEYVVPVVTFWGVIEGGMYVPFEGASSSTSSSSCWEAGGNSSSIVSIGSVIFGCVMFLEF